MRAADRQDARPQPARGTEDGSIEPSRRHHRRSGQDHARELDPDDPSSKGREMPTVRPTGRAAKQLTETTGVDAKSIHRLLEIVPGAGRFTRNESNRLPVPLSSETSRVDVPLMHSLGAVHSLTESSLGHELSDPHRLIELHLAKLCSKRRAAEWLKSSLFAVTASLR